jgi:hypothetical protein
MFPRVLRGLLFVITLLFFSQTTSEAGTNSAADCYLSWSSTSVVTNKVPSTNSIGRLYVRLDSMSTYRGIHLVLHWTPSGSANASYGLANWSAPTSLTCSWLNRGSPLSIANATDSTIVVAVASSPNTACSAGNALYFDFTNTDSTTIHGGVFSIAYVSVIDSSGLEDTLSAGAIASVQSSTFGPPPIVKQITSTYGWATSNNLYKMHGQDFADSVIVRASRDTVDITAAILANSPTTLDYSLSFAPSDTGYWHIDVTNVGGGTTRVPSALRVLSAPDSTGIPASGGMMAAAAVQFAPGTIPHMGAGRLAPHGIRTADPDVSGDLQRAGVRQMQCLWPGESPQPKEVRREDGTVAQLIDFGDYFELVFDSPEASARGVEMLRESRFVKRIQQRRRFGGHALQACTNCSGYEQPPVLEQFPNDPNMTTNEQRFEPQWYLANGSLTTGGYTGNFNEDSQAACAWRRNGAQGNSAIKIAFLDTGIYGSHPDLQYTYTNPAWGYRLIGGRNFTSEDGGNPSIVTDRHGHGTHMAGVAAARTNNGVSIAATLDRPDLGVAGVAGGWQTAFEPDSAGCRILAVKVLNDVSLADSMADITQGINWAVQQGARVLNMSFAGGRGLLPDAFDFDVRDAIYNAVASGAICVVGMGNQDDSLQFYPARLAEWNLLAAVGATDMLGRRWTGVCSEAPNDKGSSYGSWCDIAAPGYHIFTTQPNTRGPIDGFMDTSYGMGGFGTSYSTALVSGAAGVLLGLKPTLRDVDVTQILQATAWDACGEGNLEVGAGRLDICAAVDAVRDKSLQSGISHPTRLTNEGAVTLLLKSPDDLGIPDSTYQAVRYQATYNVTFPSAFVTLSGSPLTWVRMHGTHAWPKQDASPYHYFNYGWGEVVRDSLTLTSAQYRSYIYYVPGLNRWLPADSANATLEWAAIGDTTHYVIGVPETPKSGGLVTQLLGSPAGRGRAVSLAIKGRPSQGVEVSVFGVSGRLVATLTAWTSEDGTATLQWPGRSSGGRIVPAGVYLLRTRIGSEVSVNRAILLGD